MVEAKDLWKCTPLLILPSLIFFFIGNTRWAVLSLGLIPLFVIGWDIYILHFSEEGKRFHEIRKHLTETEHQRLQKLLVIWAKKCGALGGVTIVGMWFILRTVFGIEDWTYIILAFLVIFAIEAPLTSRWRKPAIDFAFSTAYAKGKGW